VTTPAAAEDGHSRADHYPAALNAYAAWYVKTCDPQATLSQRYGFAQAMVTTALDLGWIPSELPVMLAGCVCPQVTK
jgi:hypothetical protein